MKAVKYFIVSICLLAAWGIQLSAAGKSGYSITLTLSGNHSGKLSLALQTTDKMVTIDSLPFMQNGSYHFTGQRSLAPGQYAFIQNGRRLFHFLVSVEQYTDLRFNARVENGRTSEIKAIGDPENEAYIELQRFVQDMNRRQNLTQADINSIDRYTDSIARRYPNTVLSIIARNISTPPLPEYMALNDRRVLNTSILPIRLQSFFTNVVPPQSELILPQIDSILKRSTDPAVKEWCGMFMLNYFLSSNIMGMENVSIYIAKKFLNGEIKTNDKELISDLEGYVAFNEHSLVGMPAPELLLPNPQGTRISLRRIDAEYTILLFFDEDCPFCVEELPEIDKVYQQYKSKKIRVYAVYTQDHYEAWRKYILTLNPEWIHVWDPDFSSGFHRLYNVTATPMIYLLDRDKTIIGRGLDADVLQQVLSYFLD